MSPDDPARRIPSQPSARPQLPAGSACRPVRQAAGCSLARLGPCPGPERPCRGSQVAVGTRTRDPAPVARCPRVAGHGRRPLGKGHHPFVYRKMVIGPVGPIRPRDGDLVRVVDRDGLPARLRPLERPVADQPPAAGHGRRLPRPRVLGSPDRPSAIPPPRPLQARRVDQRLPGDPRRGRRPLRPDRRQIRRRPLGRGLQSGHLPADRPDPRPGGRTGSARNTSGSNVDERIALAEDFPGRPVATPKLPPA